MVDYYQADVWWLNGSSSAVFSGSVPGPVRLPRVSLPGSKKKLVFKGLSRETEMTVFAEIRLGGGLLVGLETLLRLP